MEDGELLGKQQPVRAWLGFSSLGLPKLLFGEVETFPKGVLARSDQAKMQEK